MDVNRARLINDIRTLIDETYNVRILMYIHRILQKCNKKSSY